MLVALAAAVAVATPIVGPHAVLSPRTLRPAAHAPRFAHEPLATETSPDGRKLAVLTGSHLAFFSVQSGKRLGQMRFTPDVQTLSWLTSRRLLALKAGKPARVTVVDTRRRRLLHPAKLSGRVSDTAPVGDHQAVLLAPSSGAEQELAILSARGRVLHTVALPGMRNGSLHGASPTGHALVLGSDTPLAYDVDPDTGTATRHELNLYDGSYEWVEPTTPGMLAINIVGSEDKVAILDPESIDDPVSFTDVGGLVKGAGDGFAVYDTEGTSGVTVYGADGSVRWHTSDPPSALDVEAFGTRLYVGRGRPHPAVRVFDVRTGKPRVALSGRFTFGEPERGRLRVPSFTTDAIVED